MSASVDAAAKALGQMKVSEDGKAGAAAAGAGAGAGAGAAAAADALDSAAKANLARIWEIVSDGRSLPTKYKPTLDVLVAEKDEALYAALRTYTQPGDVGELKDAVDGAVVDRLDRRWVALFADCSTSVAKSISQAEKKDKNLTGLSSLVYGEVLMSSLARVLCKHVPMKAGQVFYDVGHGTGRGVFLAALLHDFKRCSGIEILNGLYTASTEVLKKWNSDYAPKSTTGKGVGGPEITLHHSDFRLIDFSDGDVVFANSTCFDEQLMTDLARSCERLKQGTYVVTLTKGLNSTHFQVVESKQYAMSWGMATAITQKKILPPSTAEDTAAA